MRTAVETAKQSNEFLNTQIMVVNEQGNGEKKKEKDQVRDTKWGAKLLSYGFAVPKLSKGLVGEELYDRLVALMQKSPHVLEEEK